MPKPGEWIGVDLDGTLAQYDVFRGTEHIGAPIPAMLERVRTWLEAGHSVRIFTARVSEGPAAVAAIEAWCLIHVGRKLPVTNIKDHHMSELWDDRAVQVIRNTGVSIHEAMTKLAVMVAPRPGH